MTDNKELIGSSTQIKQVDENSVLMIFLNDRKEQCIYYGNKKVKPSKISKPEETEYFNYRDNVSYVLQDESGKNEDYVGELIVFKGNAWLARQDFFIDIFKNIYQGLVDGIWPNLKTSLKAISEILEIKSSDELDKTLKGYIGEISFMYWLMKHSNNMKFVKRIFESYQKKENKKHDFKIVKDGTPIKNNIDLEIKSTMGEKMTFIMKANQQMDNVNDEVYYAFVKYDTLDKQYGMSLQGMLDEIFKTLSIENKSIPNHLLLSSEKYSFNEINIDEKNIQVNILENKDLPNFYKDQDKSIIDEIKYKFNLPEYIKKKLPNYDLNKEVKSLEEKTMDGDE